MLILIVILLAVIAWQLMKLRAVVTLKTPTTVNITAPRDPTVQKPGGRWPL